MRVVRVELDSGQRLVGLRYPEQLIPEVTLFLKEQKQVDAILVRFIQIYISILATAHLPPPLTQQQSTDNK